MAEMWQVLNRLVEAIKRGAERKNIIPGVQKWEKVAKELGSGDIRSLRQPALGPDS